MRVTSRKLLEKSKVQILKDLNILNVSIKDFSNKLDEMLKRKDKLEEEFNDIEEDLKEGD